MSPIQSFYYNTTNNVDVLNVGHDVRRLVREKPLKEGFANIIAPGPGAAVTIIEPLPDIIEQLKEAFAVFPGADLKTKNKRKEDIAVAPKVRAALLGRSITIPIQDQKLLLGPREEIVLVDFEPTSKRREIVMQVFGIGVQSGKAPPPKRRAR